MVHMDRSLVFKWVLEVHCWRLTWSQAVFGWRFFIHALQIWLSVLLFIYHLLKLFCRLGSLQNYSLWHVLWCVSWDIAESIVYNGKNCRLMSPVLLPVLRGATGAEHSPSRLMDWLLLQLPLCLSSWQRTTWFLGHLSHLPVPMRRSLMTSTGTWSLKESEWTAAQGLVVNSRHGGRTVPAPRILPRPVYRYIAS